MWPKLSALSCWKSSFFFYIALIVVTGLCFAPALAGEDQLPASSTPQASAPGTDGTAPTRPEGGVQLQVPQSPPMLPQPIGYLRQVGTHPRPVSRMDVEPADAGIAGAKMALEEDNAGGKFTGDLYTLDVQSVISADAAVEALQKFLESGHHFIIVDAPAATLLKLADWAQGKDVLLFNVRDTDVSLRQEDCRANVLHTIPDRYMFADALAEFLVASHWNKWLLVRGATPGDIAYADAMKRAASRYGATIVEEREYKDISGGKRDAMGKIPPSPAGASGTPAPDYDIIVVADEEQLFGPFMPYRGGAKFVPVAGTSGLVATTWSPGHEKWGATQANNHFQKDNKRLMLPIDYQAYVAARTVGEAVTRNHGADFATTAAFITSDDFELAPFKGERQTYRQWDGQFRQPILIATDKVPVSMSPQPGFNKSDNGAGSELDSIGIEQSESKCKISRPPIAAGAETRVPE